MKYFDRVKETATTTGTGNFTLAGAATGFRTFASVLSTNDTCYYCIAGESEWEVGIGTYSAANTLTRTTVLASSNSGSAVNFSAGTKDVFLTVPSRAITTSRYGFNGLNSPTFSTFSTWVNQGSATLTDNADGTITLMVPQNASHSNRGIVKTLPSAPYTITFGVCCTFKPALQAGAGVMLRDSTSGKLYVLAMDYTSRTRLVVDKWTNVTTWSSTVFASDYFTANILFLRIRNDNTNLYFEISFDGVNFVPVFSEAKTTWLSSADQIGLQGNVNNNGQPAYCTCFHYFEA